MLRVLIVVGIFYYFIDPKEENIIWFIFAIPCLYFFQQVCKAINNIFGLK
jgi:hypothetical protein